MSTLFQRKWNSETSTLDHRGPNRRSRAWRVALHRGETISAAWLVVAAVCVYLIAFRFYALFVAKKVLGVDASRQTPASVTMTGWTTFPPTNTCCSATISRPSRRRPAGGPVLAAQMGYLPGTLWILAGVVFAGGIQDMTVLFMSTQARRPLARRHGALGDGASGRRHRADRRAPDHGHPARGAGHGRGASARRKAHGERSPFSRPSRLRC